jgi:hypothetical protein
MECENNNVWEDAMGDYAAEAYLAAVHAEGGLLLNTVNEIAMLVSLGVPPKEQGL